MLKEYGTCKDYDYAGFINQDGSFILCPSGVEHYRACELADTTLQAYLKSGGVRVLVSCHASQICIETGARQPLTDEQLHTISKTLRINTPMLVVGFISNKDIRIDNITGVKFHQFEKALSGEKSCINC